MHWKESLLMQGVAPQYVDFKYRQHPDIEAHWSEIEAIVRNKGPGVLISGTCGNGKTLTAVAILAKWTVEHGIGSRIFNTEQLYEKWAHASRFGNLSDLSCMLNDAPLLVLDDIGQGQISDSYNRWLYNVVNKRVEWQKPIVSTTNLSSDEFRELLGDALLSRLCSGHIWKYTGPDYRIVKSTTKAST